MEGSADQSPQAELSAEWKEIIDTGAAEAIENYEVINAATESSPETPLNFSPLSFSNGQDERTWDDLNESEQEYVKRVFYEALGVNEDLAQVVKKYEISSPPGASWHGTAWVDVLKTARSESENMYLHEIHRPDGAIESVVASAEFRL